MSNHGRTPRRQGGSDSPFVYPYNFVPDGGKRRSDDSNTGIGSDQGFKKLHRFEGICGRIEYTIETLSPIFIPDSEGTTLYKTGDREEDIHKVMDFFNVKDKLCIPPTSIKGPVRSVLEAATNSSFGVFNVEQKKFHYRKVTDITRRRPGIWQDGQIIPYEMAKLPLVALKNAIKTLKGMTTAPTTDDIKEFQNRPVRVKLWKIHTGNQVVVEFEIGGQSFNAVTIPNPAGLTSHEGTLKMRSSAKRMIELRASSGSKRFNCPWDEEVCSALSVHGNFPLSEKIPPNISFKYATFPELGSSGNDRVIEITYKRKTWRGYSSTFKDGILLLQRFYMDEDVRAKHKISARYVYILYNPGTPKNVADADNVLQDYRDVNDKDPHNGQVVFYEEKGGKVVEFGPVAVFKSAEERSMKDIFNGLSQYHYPNSPDKLCPATRLFGWTPEEEGRGQGIAGRVRFGPAWSDKKLEDTVQIPLKILGGPKPQYYPFYLKPKDSNIDPNVKAAYYAETPSDWSKTSGTIRGRKFYLHHPKALQNESINCIQRKKDDISPENRKTGDEAWKNLHTNQNATCAVLPAGEKFNGVIEFDSLEPYELGMLLWTLTLSDNPYKPSQNYAHKIGMGKGIGMGSVRFKIDNVYIENPLRNWFSLDDDEIALESKSEDRCNTEKLTEYVHRFKTWMVKGEDENNYTEASKYDNLPFVKDLLLVMSLDLVETSDKIQYHSPAYPADKGFEYFMEQRKKRYYKDSGTLHTNEEEPLYTPSAIKGV